MKRSRVKVTLPYEIMADIFSRLSIQDLSECRYVCKAWFKDWRGAMKDPFFINMQQPRVGNSQFLVFCHDNEDIYVADNRNPSSPLKAFKTSIDYLQGSNIEIVGSANGLLCLCLWDKKSYFICNPITKEILNLPQATYQLTTKFGSPKPLGFAYDAGTGTYKVIHSWSFRIGDIDEVHEPVFVFDTAVQIYNLGSQKWKRIKDIGNAIGTSSESSQVLLNGALHWVIFKRACRCGIASFDIGKETIRLFNMPSELCLLSFNKRTTRTLGSVRGRLCVVDVTLSYVRPTHHINVWIMKRYGVNKSWSKKYVISTSDISLLQEQLGHFDSLRVVREGSILLQGSKGEGYYDLKKKEFKKIVIKGIQPWTGGLDIVAHVGSLVSPKSIHGTITKTPSP